MSKLAPETIVMAPGESARKNMNFAADLDAEDIGQIPNFQMQVGGPVISLPAYSGKKAQIFIDATVTPPGIYYLDCTVTSNTVPIQTFKGRGKLVVSNLG